MEDLQSPLILSRGTSGSELEAVVCPRAPSINSPISSEPHSLPVSSGPHSLPLTNPERAPKEAGKRRRERVTWAGITDEPKHVKQAARKSRKVRTNNIPEEEYPAALQTYSLYEDGYGLGHGGGRVITNSSVGDLSPTYTGSSFMSEEEDGGGIIDGRYSIGSADGLQDFVRVEAPSGYSDGGMSTTQELEACKKTVLSPYLYFLKLIGWRRIRGSRHDLEQPKLVICGNIIYPSLIFLLLVYACISQALTCFLRDQAVNDDDENGLTVVMCEDHIVTRILLGDVLLLAAYLWGLYVFRVGAPEHLATLMETVFLSYNSTHVKNRQNKLIWSLRFFLVGGAVWLVFSTGGSVIRLFSLRLLGDKTYIAFLTLQNLSNVTNPSQVTHSQAEDVLRFLFVISAIVGFVCFDLLYIAVVITYTSQSQLLWFYISSILDKVRTKAYSLGDAIKDIRHIYEFLQVMNGKLATLTSLCLFIFISGCVASVYSLYTLDPSKLSRTQLYLGVAVGVCNLFQWTILTIAPLIQAARLTSACRRLRRLGLEIGARPFIYASTPQLVLDSFVQYTNATRYTAKLVSVPIYPSFVVGALFIFGLLATFLIGILSTFRFAMWF